VDLTTQHLMRCSYFGWPLTGYHEEEVDNCRRALEDDEAVTFWCEPVLTGCLCILWVLEALVTQRVDLTRAYLALSPGRTDIQALNPEAIRQAVQERIPVSEVLDPLIVVRRHLASDCEHVCADRSPLPPPLCNWVAVTDRLVDFLPDGRGLDLLDEILLDRLAEEEEAGEEWPTAAVILGRVHNHSHGHALREERLWERLLELSAYSRMLQMWQPDDENRLVEARFEGDASFGQTRFRLTRLGREARDGTVDALPLCSFVRWVGGRQVSRERPLRRSAESAPRR
jgi:hypothetical protein